MRKQGNNFDIFINVGGLGIKVCSLYLLLWE